MDNRVLNSLNDISISNGYLHDILKNNFYNNDVIVPYYDRLASEFP
ncbi:hypothetical protein PV526_19680 [Clostridioides difficile]|nr:hypothetical protein [Clostridioides difficile]MDE3612431.1 hypothetical protein [Clostridioides difficile]MDM9793633.1 hypothetical protein [Clostridioides difficile]